MVLGGGTFKQEFAVLAELVRGSLGCECFDEDGKVSEGPGLGELLGVRRLRCPFPRPWR